MTSKLKKRIVFYIAIYFLVGIGLFFVQKKLIYFPTPEISHNYQNVIVPNDGFNIHVTVLNSGKGLAKSIVYFGGNAEAVECNAPDFLKEFPGCVIFLVSYRGYGGSAGDPDEKDIYSDALKVFDTLVASSEHVVIFGRSLGSGVATYVASKREVSKLILITPFDSVQSIAQSRFMIYPMGILLTQKFLSIDRVKDIKSDCLILIAENDEVIPFKHSIKLANEFPPNQVTKYIVKGARHNDISDSKEYFESIIKFLN